MAVLTGNKDIEPTHNLTVGISAIMLAETARYPASFVTTLCMLDLIRNAHEVQNNLWKLFFGHKDDCNSYKIECVNDGIVFDIMRILGGLHPMSQGNSFNQTKEGSTQPKFGMHLVDFKSHIILMKWLSIILEKEQNITPHLSAEIVETLETKERVENLSDYFMNKNLGALNPHIFDRFSRRLDSFNFMLIEKPPIRDTFPNDFMDDAPVITAEGVTACTTKIVSFVQNNHNYMRKQFPFIVDDKKLKIKATNQSCSLSLMQRLELALQTNFNDESTLIQILTRDPDFYQIYFFIAQNWFNKKFSDDEECLKNVLQAFDYASTMLALAPKKDSLYYGALCIRIKCLYRIRNFPSYVNLLENDVNEYLSNHEDSSDPDYWRVFAMRAVARQQLNKDNSTIYRDFDTFLKNIEPEKTGPYDNAILYMKNKLRSVTASLLVNKDNSELLFEVANIFHCLRAYKPMLDNVFKAVVIAIKSNTPQLDDLKEKLSVNLERYYTHNKLRYLESYAQELWDKISLGEIKEKKHLDQFLDERKIATTPNDINTYVTTNVSASLYSATHVVNDTPSSNRKADTNATVDYTLS